MRKRLVIGAIAAVMIGVAGWVVYEPGKGTIEWHKKKYLRARKQPKIEEWINFHMAGMVPGTRQLADALSSWRDSKAKRHQRALVELGYLSERRIPVASGHGRDVWSSVFYRLHRDDRRETNKWELTDEFFGFGGTSNFAWFISLPREAPTWELLIRQADVPDADDKYDGVLTSR